jgi:hypothetical protein
VCPPQSPVLTPAACRSEEQRLRSTITRVGRSGLPLKQLGRQYATRLTSSSGPALFGATRISNGVLFDHLL